MNDTYAIPNAPTISAPRKRLARIITDDYGLAWIDAVTGKPIIRIDGAHHLVVTAPDAGISITIGIEGINGGLRTATKFAEERLADLGYTTKMA